jgi:spermidine/putrescine transport system permease protein
MEIATTERGQPRPQAYAEVRRVGWIRLRDWPSPILAAITVFAFILMYAPLVIIAILSLDKTSIAAFPLQGFTTKWYEELWRDPSIKASFINTLYIAAGALALSTAVGLPAAFAVDRLNFRGKEAFRRLVYVPVVLPGLLNGIVILNYFVFLKVPLGLHAVIILHGTVLAAVMFSMVFARLVRMDPSLREAAMDLGATPRQTFRRVLLPILKTPIIGAWLLIFMLSVDDLLGAFFTIGQGSNLQMEIWSRLRVELSPELHALSTLFFLASVLIITLYSVLLERERHVIG